MHDAPKILVVEDELDLAEPLVEGLVGQGFHVRLAATGEDARRALDEHWDLVILDLMLPDISGESLLSYMKQKPDYPAVLVLTAKSGLQDKLGLFRQGCDDYITKPYIFEELLERARALLRRSQRVLPAPCSYEDLVLDPEKFRFSLKSGDSVQLTPKEAAILRLLMARPGHTVSRKEILSGVWGLKEEPSSNFIGVHIFNLRKKFAHLGREDWFQTLRSAGFMVSRP